MMPSLIFLESAWQFFSLWEVIFCGLWDGLCPHCHSQPFYSWRKRSPPDLSCVIQAAAIKADTCKPHSRGQEIEPASRTIPLQTTPGDSQWEGFENVCVQCIYLYECISGRFWINGNSKTLHRSETDRLKITGPTCRSLYTIHTRPLLPSATTRSVVIISSLVSMNSAWIPAECLSSSVFPNWKKKKGGGGWYTDTCPKPLPSPIPLSGHSLCS